MDINNSIQVGTYTIKNRLVLPPMAQAKTPNGFVNDELIQFYDEKTKSGAIGLVITEHCYVVNQGKAHNNQVSIASDDTIEGLSKVVDVIHKNGSVALCQISHAGSASKSQVINEPIVGPSAIMNPRWSDGEIPSELTIDEIEQIIQYFKDGARRATQAGYDGIEIHSAHGYLLNQFYSPLTNKRTDRYGGSIENRIRIHLEIIQAVKEVVPKDKIIALRLGAFEEFENGATIEDAQKACQLFENAGVHLLDISGSFKGYTRPNCNEPGYFKEASRAVKKCV